MLNLLHLCSVIAVLFATVELRAQDGIVTFPKSLSSKVGIAAGETAHIDYTIQDYLIGNGRRPSYAEVIQFEGVTESGSLIWGSGVLTFERLRAIGDGPLVVSYGKLSLDWLLVEDFFGNVYTATNGTLDFQTYPGW